jgi:thioredoxin-like negative regulator of GroEL
MVAPEVKKLATRFAGKALVLKVDTDKEGEVAGRFGIQSIPTFMVFKDGKPVVRESGARNELGLAKLVEQAA